MIVIIINGFYLKGILLDFNYGFYISFITYYRQHSLFLRVFVIFVWQWSYLCSTIWNSIPCTCLQSDAACPSAHICKLWSYYRSHDSMSDTWSEHDKVGQNVDKRSYRPYFPGYHSLTYHLFPPRIKVVIYHCNHKTTSNNPISSHRPTV